MIRTKLARLAKLETVSRGANECGPVAVVVHPFPKEDVERWALDILESLPMPAGVWVLEGQHRRVVLPPTFPTAMAYGGPEEGAWLDAGNTFPHYVILGDGRGGLLVERFESAEHERQRGIEIRAELSQPSGGVC